MNAPVRWSPAGGYVLEPNAIRAATETEKNVLVVAGPGAGKTEMLAQRADFLLRTGVCRYPRRILAISFKTDAAANLRSRVRSRCGAELAARLDSNTFHGFAKRLIDRFRVALTGIDALDADYEVGDQRIERRQITFNDMVPLAISVLEVSSVARNAVRNTYSHVFLDEFQDCTNLQYSLLRAAFGSTPAIVTAVGDTKQRIMAWAGALDGIFEQFSADFEAEVLHLYQNYRSAPRVRRVHNAMVKVMDPGAAVPDAELAGDEGQVDISTYATGVDEAQALAETIEAWIKVEEVPPSEIAVLVRQQAHLSAGRLMEELDARGIAYRNEQALQDDFAEPLGQLILDFLAVTIHDRQPDVYRRLMEILAPSSGDDEIDHQHALRWRGHLQEARTTLRSVADSGGASDRTMSAIEAFLMKLGRDRLAALSPSYSSGTRLDQLLGSILERLRELADRTGFALDDFAQVTDDGCVRVLTIHKSKGLEFQSVVVLGVESETFWSPDESANRAEFFVAVSRAKQRLLLTVAEHRERPPGAEYWSENRSPHEEFLGYALS